MLAYSPLQWFTILGTPFFGSVLGIGYLLFAVGLWKVFAKAGRTAWLGLIPIVNLVVLARVAGKSALWWLLLPTCLFFIPPLLMGFGVASKFGRKPGLGWLLGLLPPIGYLALGFSTARYYGSMRS